MSKKKKLRRVLCPLCLKGHLQVVDSRVVETTYQVYVHTRTESIHQIDGTSHDAEETASSTIECSNDACELMLPAASEEEVIEYIRMALEETANAKPKGKKSKDSNNSKHVTMPKHKFLGIIRRQEIVGAQDSANSST